MKVYKLIIKDEIVNAYNEWCERVEETEIDFDKFLEVTIHNAIFDEVGPEYTQYFKLEQDENNTFTEV